MKHFWCCLVIPFLWVIANSEAAHAAIPSPPGARGVVCGAYPTAEEAAQHVEPIRKKGYEPVWVHEGDEGDGWNRVLVGKCERYADAYLLKESLRENGYPEAWVKQVGLEVMREES